MKVTMRFFVLVTHARKGGHSETRATEYATHEEACRVACQIVLDLLDLTGELSETVEVYVGSKTQLDRKLRS